jgi:hypothetical protein
MDAYSGQYAHPLGMCHIGFVRTTIKVEPGGHRILSFALYILALPWCNFLPDSSKFIKTYKYGCLKLNYRKKVSYFALNFLPWEFLLIKKLDFAKN